MTTNTRFSVLLIIVLLVIIYPRYAHADGQPELLLFLSAGPTYNEIVPESGPDGSDFVIDADAMFSYLSGRFRMLGELIISTEEIELERIQFGWQLRDNSFGWIGRFHTPSSYWNFNYHHGQYLQTAITRPNIEQFEDDGGFLPAHITGVMLETSLNLNDADSYQISFSLGAAPVVDNNELRPLGFDDHDPDNKLSADLRVAFLPDQLEQDQAGFIASWSDLLIEGNLAAEQKGIHHVEQYKIGVYADWRRQTWRFISSVVRISNKMFRQSWCQTQSFYAGYIQAENELDEKWTLFGRLESTSDKATTEYLDLFRHSILQRQLIGLRLDVLKNHAITIELSRAETRSEKFDQAMLQWSSVLP